MIFASTERKNKFTNLFFCLCANVQKVEYLYRECERKVELNNFSVKR